MHVNAVALEKYLHVSVMGDNRINQPHTAENQDSLRKFARTILSMLLKYL